MLHLAISWEHPNLSAEAAHHRNRGSRRGWHIRDCDQPTWGSHQKLHSWVRHLCSLSNVEHSSLLTLECVEHSSFLPLGNATSLLPLKFWAFVFAPSQKKMLSIRLCSLSNVEHSSLLPFICWVFVFAPSRKCWTFFFASFLILSICLYSLSNVEHLSLLPLKCWAFVFAPSQMLNILRRFRVVLRKRLCYRLLCFILRYFIAQDAEEVKRVINYCKVR